MAEKETTMKLKVNLQCQKCFKKVKKVLCNFPEIRDQVYDEKNNVVTIKVLCCNPEKIRDKICCKGCGAIKTIEIVKPEAKPEEKPKPKPKPNPSSPQPSCSVPCCKCQPGVLCSHGCGRPACCGCHGWPVCCSCGGGRPCCAICCNQYIWEENVTVCSIL